MFAAGYIHSPELGEIGVVWKNGEILYQFAERDPMIIYDSRSRVELGSINIIDGDVYVSGRIGNKVPKIWKNGIEYQGIAEGIYGPGKSVYLLKNGMVYQDQF